MEVPGSNMYNNIIRDNSPGGMYVVPKVRGDLREFDFALWSKVETIAETPNKVRSCKCHRKFCPASLLSVLGFKFIFRENWSLVFFSNQDNNLGDERVKLKFKIDLTILSLFSASTKVYIVQAKIVNFTIDISLTERTVFYSSRKHSGKYNYSVFNFPRLYEHDKVRKFPLGNVAYDIIRRKVLLGEKYLRDIYYRNTRCVFFLVRGFNVLNGKICRVCTREVLVPRVSSFVS